MKAKILSCALLLLFLSCTKKEKPWNQALETETLADDLTIIYSSNVVGELEPCGCIRNPVGGIVRKAQFFENLEKEKKAHLLYFDTGDLFFKSVQVQGFLENQWKVQAEILMETYSTLPVTAITVGEKDFALGRDFLMEGLQKYHIPVVSSNIIDSLSGKPLFQEYKIEEWNGHKIGVFALSDPEYFTSLPQTLIITIQDPTSVAKKMLQFFRKNKIDHVILLSHLGLAQDVRLALNISGIDIIISGHSEDLLRDVRKVKNTLIVQAGHQGHYVGQFDLSLGKDMKKFKHKIVPLDTTLEPGPEKTRELMKRFKNFLQKEVHGESSSLLHKNSTGYETSSYCIQCHQKQAKVWQNSHHASAFLPLFIKDQHNNKECITCHTVGFQQAGGFGDLRLATLKKGKGIDQAKMVDAMILHKGDLKKTLRELIDKKIDEFNKLIKKNEGQAFKSFYEIQIGALNKIKNQKSLRGTHISFFDNREIYNYLKSLYSQALDREKPDKNYWGVQCEHCHGARRGHPFERSDFPKKVNTDSCLVCHNNNHSPRFDVKSFNLVQGRDKAGKFDFICAQGKPGKL